MKVLRQEAKSASSAQARTTNLLDAVETNRLLTLIVEPTSKCNLSCSFCDIHSGRMPAAKKYIRSMEHEVWCKLISQIRDLGYQLKQFQVHGGGEPLLHPNIVEFIKLAHESSIAECIRLTTNGTLLYRETLDKLIDAGVTDFRVSVDAGTRELWTHLKTHGKKSGFKLFDNLVNNVMDAIDRINAGKTGLSLYIKYPVLESGCEDKYGVTNDHMLSVVNLFSEKIVSNDVHLIEMPVVTLNDGMIEKKRKYSIPCELPFYSLFVKSDGRVTACCADVTDELTLGSILEQSLEDIVGGKNLYNLRLAHLDSSLESYPLCLYCGNRTCVDLESIGGKLREFITSR